MVKKDHILTFKKSHNHKPTSKWQCGNANKSCLQGPDNRGNCPSSSKCQPRRRARTKIASAALWTTLFTLGAILIVFSNQHWLSLLSPGPLSSSHAHIENCATCHSAFNDEKIDWFAAATHASIEENDTKLCLKCHALGNTPTNPHNLANKQLLAISANAQLSELTNGSINQRFAKANLDSTQNEHSCNTCHNEHNRFENLTSTTDQQCVVCHKAQFTSFSTDHPEFKQYPFNRRTRIQFDHTSHISKHFTDKDYSDLAPTGCQQCHLPDSKGENMIVRGFDKSCASCHLDEIVGTNRATEKGLTIFTIPGLDLETLADNNITIGEWPEDAEDEVTPFMALWLKQMPGMTLTLKELKGIDLLDLSEASQKELLHVQALATSVKSIIYDLRMHGADGFIKHIKASTNINSTDTMHLVGMLPPSLIKQWQRQWFPSMMKESTTTNVTSSYLDTSQNISKEKRALIEDNDSIDLTSAATDDDSWFDNILTDSESEDESIDEIDSEHEAEVEWSSEDKAMAGGWYQDEFTLRYRPSGHHDQFLKSWMSLSSSIGNSEMNDLLTALRDENSPGVCSKCHSADISKQGSLVVNWQGNQRDMNQHDFTQFSHLAHFSLPNKLSCTSCHQLNTEAEYEKGFNDNKSSTFSSNFNNIKQEKCSSCHNEDQANEQCLTCHNYHIGNQSFMAMPDELTKEK